MYTLHTINHKTGEEQIREFFTYNAALFEWEMARIEITKHYGSFYKYYKNRVITTFNDNLSLHSDYMDMYLEKCEE